MQRHDYFWAVIAGVLTALFVFPILKNLQVEIPVFKLWIVLGVPLLWIAGLFIAGFLIRFLPWIYQLAKFFVVGFMNTALDFGILNFLSHSTGIYSGTEIIGLNVISFSVALVNSYIWNRKWTFSKHDRASLKEFIQFFIVSFIAVVINTSIVFGITTYVAMSGISPAALENIAKIIATAVGLIWNFLGYKFIVFKT